MEAELKFDMSENVENWAPPPPVILPQERSPQPPQTSQDDEFEFESTLSTLVDHFNSLPPPAYGEPPELPELTNRLEGTREKTEGSTRGHSIIWMVGCSLVLGGSLAAGGIFALNYGVFDGGSQDQPEAPVIVATEIAIPEVKIVPQATTAPLEEKAQPQTEPLNERIAKTTTALGAPISKPIVDDSEGAGQAVQAPVPTVIREKRVKHVSKVQRKAKKWNTVDTNKKNTALAVPSNNEWEDPYK